MTSVPAQVADVRVGGSPNAPAGGNARIGTAFADQVAQRRPPQEAPTATALFFEKRMDASGQCTIRSTMQGLIATTYEAVIEGEELDAGTRESANVTPSTCTPWMSFNLMWITHCGLYIRDTAVHNTVQHDVLDFLSSIIPAQSADRFRCPPNELCSELGTAL